MAVIATGEVDLKLSPKSKERLEKDLGGVGSKSAKNVEQSLGQAGVGAGAKFEKGFSSAFSKLSSSLSSQLGPAGPPVEKLLSKVGGVASGLGAIAPAAAAAGAGLGVLAAKGVGEFGKLADQIRGLQRVTGASATDASKLAAALRATGTDASVAERGFFLLSKTVQNTPQKLADVGVAIAKNKDGSVDLFGTLGNVADAYQKAGKGAEGNAIAAAAFGRAGKDLLPILGKSREELEKIAKTAGLRGLLLSQEQIDQALKFKLAMRDLGESVKGLEVSLGSGLVPGLAKLAGALTDIVDLANTASKPIGGLGGLVSTAFDVMIGPISSASDLLHGRFKKGLLEAVPIAGPFAQSLFHIGEGHDKASEAGGKHAQTEEELATSLAQAAQDADSEAEALDKLLTSQIALVDSTLGLQGSQDALARAQASVTEKQNELTKAQQSGDPSAIAEATRNFTEAQHGLEDAANRVAHNLADQAEQQALAIGQQFDATQKAAAYKEALLQQAAAIGGPVGDALRQLANQIQAIPDKKNVSIGVDIRYNAADLAVLNKIRNLETSGVTFSQHGGPYRRGELHVVGEHGPELFAAGTSGMILPNEFLRMRGDGGGSSQPIVVQVMLDGEVVAESIVNPMAEALRRRDASLR